MKANMVLIKRLSIFPPPSINGDASSQKSIDDPSENRTGSTCVLASALITEVIASPWE